MCRPIKKFYTLSFAMVLLVVVFSGALFAVSVPQSTEQLVENSSDVIRGTVLSQKSQWDSSHKYIFTEINIEVSDVIYGPIDNGNTISIIVPGGEVDDIGLAVEHAPKFDDDEEVVLFLTEIEGIYTVTSWEMGKFSVQSGNIKEKNVSVDKFVEEIKAVNR